VTTSSRPTRSRESDQSFRIRAAALVVAALIFGGCGGSKTPSPLSTLPPNLINSPIEAVSPVINMVTPGLRMQLRVTAYNLARQNMVLDSLELVDADGVTQHDAWTLSPTLLVDESRWLLERRKLWLRDPGARPLAGTVIPAFLGSSAEKTNEQPNASVFVTVDVTIAGKRGDAVANRHAVTVGGFRVTAHLVGGKKFTTVLTMGFTGCFSSDYKPPLCPPQTPLQVLTELGLPYKPGH